MSITLREFAGPDDYAACVALQRETWGAAFTEVVPASLLMISQKIGGIGAGAWDASGRMVGFVWGLTGLTDRRPAHWSHMLAVRPEARDRGLGARLKQYQRRLLVRRGVTVMYWTFDPLVSRNAHLNLARLGVEIDAYVPDYYGADTDSDLHSGLGTDRFVVRWRLRGGRRRRVPRIRTSVPVVNAAERAGSRLEPRLGHLPDLPAVRIAIPQDIQAVKQAAPDEAWQWRLSTRQAFLHYLALGYRIRRFQRHPTGVSSYLLSRP